MRPKIPTFVKYLCISEGKARKEKAIDNKKIKRFVDDIEILTKSIKKGNIKKLDKIEKRLENKLNRHTIVAKMYNVDIVVENGKAIDISVSNKNATEVPEKLYGCYVPEFRMIF